MSLYFSGATTKQMKHRQKSYMKERANARRNRCAIYVPNYLVISIRWWNKKSLRLLSIGRLLNKWFRAQDLQRSRLIATFEFR